MPLFRGICLGRLTLSQVDYFICLVLVMGALLMGIAIVTDSHSVLYSHPSFESGVAAAVVVVFSHHTLFGYTLLRLHWQPHPLKQSLFLCIFVNEALEYSLVRFKYTKFIDNDNNCWRRYAIYSWFWWCLQSAHTINGSKYQWFVHDSNYNIREMYIAYIDERTR